MKINDFVEFEMATSLDVPRYAYQNEEEWQDKGPSGVFQRARVVDQNEHGFSVPYYRKDGVEFIWIWPVNSYDISVSGFIKLVD